MSYCPNCGADAGDANFCPACGAQITSQAQQQPAKNIKYQTKTITVQAKGGCINPLGIGTNRGKFKRLTKQGWEIVSQNETRSFGGGRHLRTEYLLRKPK